MTIKYYQYDVSPPCRMVTMVMKALKLEVDVIVTNPTTGETRTPEYLEMNPRGKIPCINDNGFAIFESRAIATYLCNKYEKGNDSTRLYPVEPDERGIVDQMLYVSNVIYEDILEYVNIIGIFYGDQKTTADSKIPDVTKGLQLCETFLTKHEYMAGSHLTLADIFMACSLTMLSLPGYDGIKDYPKTQTWLNKVKALPYYDEVNKKPMEIFVEAYQKKIKE